MYDKKPHPVENPMRCGFLVWAYACPIMGKARDGPLRRTFFGKPIEKSRCICYNDRIKPPYYAPYPKGALYEYQHLLYPQCADLPYRIP